MRVCGFAGLRVCGFAGLRVCGFAGLRVCGFAGLRVCGFAGLRVCGFAGLRVCGFAGLRVCGFAGLRVYGFESFLLFFRVGVWFEDIQTLTHLQQDNPVLYPCVCCTIQRAEMRGDYTTDGASAYRSMLECECCMTAFTISPLVRWR